MTASRDGKDKGAGTAKPVPVRERNRQRRVALEEEALAGPGAALVHSRQTPRTAAEREAAERRRRKRSGDD